MLILHTADIHLRDRQYARSFRGDDFRTALHRVIDIAIARKVDAIINGGDTFQTNRPSPRLQAILLEAHGRLTQAGIPMLSITGNHDAADPSYLEFPALYEYYKGMDRMPDEKEMDAYLADRKMIDRSGIVCIDNAVYTLPNGMTVAGYPAAVDNAAMLAEQEANPADIVAWHGAVAECVPFPMRNSLTLSDLDIPGVKAWLLGDIHLPSVMRTPQWGALVAYPGPIEFCEGGERAIKKVDIYPITSKDADFPDPEFIELPGRPVVFLTAADEAQADQACEKVQQTIRDNPGVGPLVFLRYDKAVSGIVTRLNDILDPKDSVFMSGVFQTKFQSTPGVGGQCLKPDMAEIVSEVVPVGTRLHQLAMQLSRRGVNPRQILTEWVDAQLATQNPTN